MTIFIILIFLFGGFGAFLFTNNQNSNVTITTVTTKANDTKTTEPKTDGILIFYSSTCPHCEKVKEFLKGDGANLTIGVQMLKIDDPIKDKSNLALALGKIKECNLGDSWGVPLMYHNGKCIMGDVPVIDYLNQYKQK